MFNQISYKKSESEAELNNDRSFHGFVGVDGNLGNCILERGRVRC
jgi:hypothetical protein